MSTRNKERNVLNWKLWYLRQHAACDGDKMSKVYFLRSEDSKLRFSLIKIMINVDYITGDNELHLLCQVRACVIY